MFAKFPNIRRFLVDIRSRYSPTNTFKVSRQADFQSKANIYKCKFIIPAGNRVFLEEGARLKKLCIRITGTNNELIIRDGAFAVGDFQLMGDNNRIEIGAHSRVTGGQLLAGDRTSITLGERCMFAKDIDIRTTDSHPIFDKDGKRINPAKSIKIGDRVWLASGVAVLKGALIENDVVIGFRSVVTSHLPANSVAVGTPAKVVKTGITWSR